LLGKSSGHINFQNFRSFFDFNNLIILAMQKALKLSNRYIWECPLRGIPPGGGNKYGLKISAPPPSVSSLNGDICEANLLDLVDEVRDCGDSGAGQEHHPQHTHILSIRDPTTFVYRSSKTKVLQLEKIQ
jgi:hypothetical protein